uniref:VWFA domain-containing protein n=2 Tax=Caenorhabditis tropicalis TaxID=1561998 RepID=A0A1I7UTE7_9PELO
MVVSSIKKHFEVPLNSYSAKKEKEETHFFFESTMKLAILLIGVYGCLALYDPSSYTDRQCGSDMPNLWLDVVAVVDNSKGMTLNMLTGVATVLVSIFNLVANIGINPNNPRSTRIGLITYNENATLNADLNAYQSMDDLFSGVFGSLSAVSSSRLSYLSNGLETARVLLKNQSFGTPRDHYRKVVIVFAASYYKGSSEWDPIPAAQSLKDDGVIVMTVASVWDATTEFMNDLASISSPGLVFDISAQNDTEMIKSAVMMANCYCPNAYIQYRELFEDKSSTPYGSCLHPNNVSTSWKASQLNCRNRKAYLATEFTQHKHDFIVESVTSTTGFHPPLSYHIGLNQVLGKWVWDQPQGLPQIPLQSYSDWNPMYPIQSSSMNGVENFQNGQMTGWQNIDQLKVSTNYICESYACDTDNYCDANGNI